MGLRPLQPPLISLAAKPRGPTLKTTDHLPAITPRGYFTRIVPESLDDLLLSHIMGRRAKPVSAMCWSSKEERYWEETGSFRVGSYAPDVEGNSKWGTIDIDGGPDHKFPVADPEGVAVRVALNYVARGYLPYLEKSASATGFHVWTFYQPAADAEAIRKLAFAMIPENIPLLNGGFANPKASQGVEVFPKQSRIATDGFGSLVMLPFWYGAKPSGNQFYNIKREVI